MYLDECSFPAIGQFPVRGSQFRPEWALFQSLTQLSTPPAYTPLWPPMTVKRVASDEDVMSDVWHACKALIEGWGCKC